MLGEAVGLIADVLEEFEGEVIFGEADGSGSGVGVEEFLFFCEGDDHWGFDVHGGEDVHGGMELSESAVDEDEIWEEFVGIAGVAISTGDDLLDGEIVVVAEVVSDFVAAVGVFEGEAVDEADFGADHFVALEVGDVDAFEDSGWFWEGEDFLEFEEALVGVGDEGFGLPELFGACGGAVGEGL